MRGKFQSLLAYGAQTAAHSPHFAVEIESDNHNSRDAAVDQALHSNLASPYFEWALWTYFARGCALLIMGAAAGAYAYYAIFSKYMLYDDEGYMLITLRDFFRGEALYDDIYSIYGPFYYAYYYMLWTTGLFVPTHDAGRIVTIVHWMIASSALALATFRMSGKFWVSCLVFLQCVAHLSPLVTEPAHPQGLVILGLSLYVLVASKERGDRMSWLGVAALGLIAGAMAGTKINVGAFTYLAIFCTLGLFIACDHLERFPRITRACYTASAIGAVIFPAVLMRQLVMQEQWVFRYCVVATVAITTVVLVASRGSRAKSQLRVTWTHFFIAHAGMAAAAIMAVAFVVSRGSSIDGIWRQILLIAVQLPNQYQVPSFAFSSTSLFLALVAVVYATYWAMLRPGPGELAVRTLSFVKVVCGASFFISGFFWSADTLVACLGPWLWLVLAPRRTEMYGARVALAFLAVFHLLQAYPVFAVQASLSSLLLVPAFALVLNDGLSEISAFASWPKLSGRYVRIARSGIILGLMLAYGMKTDIVGVRAYYYDQSPLNMPGANRVRLDTRAVSEIHWLVNNIREHADTFITLPGMYSFNLWAGIDPPTTFNAEIWTYELSDSRQQDIIDAIDRRERVCVVFCPKAEYMWEKTYKPPSTPLTRYVFSEFHPTMETQNYRFYVRNGAAKKAAYNVLLRGEREFNGVSSVVTLPDGLAPKNVPYTYELQFQTTRSGALLGQQDRRHPTTPVQGGWRPVIYVGSDGRLYIAPQEFGKDVVASSGPVNDDKLHHLAIVVTVESWTVFLDGANIASVQTPKNAEEEDYWQLGDAYCEGFPNTSQGWFPFAGSIRDARLHFRALLATEVQDQAQRALTPQTAQIETRGQGAVN
jgi:hypothetical protein